MEYAGEPLDNRAVDMGSQWGSVAANTLVLWPEDKSRVDEAKPVYICSSYGAFIQVQR